MEKFEKLAAQGALAMAGGLVGVYGLLLYVWRPTLTGGAPGATGGITPLLWAVLAIAMAVPVAVLAGVHVVFARDLQGGAKPMY